MTTAHRPTWKAAVGRAQEGGWSSGGAVSSSRSVLDAPAHTKLKLRKGSQLKGTAGRRQIADGRVVQDEDRRRKVLQDSLRKLEQAEASVANAASRIGHREIDPSVEEESRVKLLKQTAEVDDERIRAKYDDADDDAGGKAGAKWDSDDGDGTDLDQDPDDDDSDDSDDDDDDDEDEEAALQAELAKIRAEREAAKAKEEAEAKQLEEERMEEAALVGNPLLSASSESQGSGRLKRRWNDDVVFRNQAKGEPDQNKKRFINDTVRNDFHRRFLNKFIR